MSARVRYCRAEKGTINLSKMRTGSLATEPVDGGFILSVVEEDERRFTVNIATREAAIELLSGIALAFPELI